LTSIYREVTGPDAHSVDGRVVVGGLERKRARARGVYEDDILTRFEVDLDRVLGVERSPRSEIHRVPPAKPESVTGSGR
jgi:hypothetical protein